MSEAMKARLIGVVVLVVLGFVALNALLGGLAPSQDDDEPVVIIRPQAKKPELAKPAPTEQSASAEPEQPTDQQPAPKSEPEPAPRRQTNPATASTPQPTTAPKPERQPPPKSKPQSTTKPTPESTTKAEPRQETRPATPPKPAPPAAPKPAGHWWVQVASFGDADNANRMIADLRGAGFDTDRTRVTVGGRTYTRVLAGPFASERAAESARARIAVRFGASGRVVERR